MLGERLHALQTLTGTLAESTTLETVTPRVLQAIAEPLGWELGSLWRAGENHELSCVGTWQARPLASEVSEAVTRELTSDGSKTLAERVVARCQPEWCSDITREGDLSDLRFVSGVGMHAALAFPIAAGADAFGAIELFSRDVVEPDGELLALVTSIGSQIGHYIEARSAEDAARGSLERERDQRARAEVSQERARRLALQLLDAEEQERGRLSQALHDESVQNLLVVLQDLREAQHGDPEALVRAEAVVSMTVRQLREVVFELHPVGSAHEGTVGAIRAVADRQARRAGFRHRTSVAEDVRGTQDLLLFSVARELLSNIAKHAAASEVSLSIDKVDGRVVFEVGDDGRGFDPASVDAAPEAGHVGLTLITERLEALGGSLEIKSARGQGTQVRAVFPAANVEAKSVEPI
jgi:signal transduction histidine kinase